MPNNLVATVLQDYISNYSGRLDKNEQRPSYYGTLEVFKKQTADPQGILDPAVQANIERSFNQTVKIPVIDYKDITITNARSCVFQTDGLVSKLISLSKVTYSFGFKAAPMQHYENYVAYQQAVAKLIDAGMQKLAATIDAACVATLEANKNQLFDQKMLDFYAVAGGAFQVPNASQEDLYNQIDSILQTADFPVGNTDIALNPIGTGIVRRLAGQGAQNAINETFQLLGYTWYPDNRIVNSGPTVKSTMFAVAPGSVAIKFRNSPDAKAGSRIHESKYWELFPNAPYIGAAMDVYYQADCADITGDQAGIPNLTQTKAESWQFAVDVFQVAAYNSNPAGRYNPIFKFETLA